MITKWLETAKKGHSGNKDMEPKKHLGVLQVGVWTASVTVESNLEYLLS